jgi:MarR family transcriptional regulator, multiple antibiotic resistance protein MarR
MGDIYDSATYEPRKGVGHMLHRVRTEMLAAVDRDMAADEQLAAMEVTSAQFIILATLSMGTAKSASDLCKYISYDAGAMTRMIDRLEEKGLLRRSRDPGDRRLVNLELTEKGSEAMPRMRDVAMRVLNRFLHGFTKAEARQLEGFLARMLENAPRGA